MCGLGHVRLAGGRVAVVVASGWSANGGRPVLRMNLGACRSARGPRHAGWVALSGELDAFTASRVSDSLDDFCAFAGDVVIDTSAVTFIDLAGVRLLERMVAGAADRQRSGWLHEPSSSVRRLLGMLGPGMTGRVCSSRDQIAVDPLTAAVWSIGTASGGGR